MAILSCSTVLGKWPQGQVPGPGEYSSIPVKLCKNPKCIASWTKRLRCSCHRSFNRRPIGSPRAWLARETERSKQHPVPTLQKLTIEVFAILVIVVDNQLPLVLLSVGEILSAKGGTNNVFCSVLSRLFWHGVFLPRLFSLLLLTPRLLASQFSPFFPFFLYSQLSTAVSLILSSSVSSFWFFLSNSALQNLPSGPPGRTLSAPGWGWSGARWKCAGWFPTPCPHQPRAHSGRPELRGLVTLLSTLDLHWEKKLPHAT